jgi:uncharacterized LabA/DUF88 family protein
MPIAVAIDGAYFLKRFKHSFPDLDATNADEIAFAVSELVKFHVKVRLSANPVLQAIDAGAFDPTQLGDGGVVETPELYRIFFYDCAPLTKRVQYPVSGKSLDFSKTDVAIIRENIHRSLCQQRKLALRLGRLNDGISGWKPTADAVKRWLSDPAQFDPVDEDFVYDVTQKGVDMRLGLDVASMAFKKQINQLILVAADADFVPAVKLARREGIDVVLDTMWGNAAPDLQQHVDGVRNCRISGRPKSQEN